MDYNERCTKLHITFSLDHLQNQKMSINNELRLSTPKLVLLHPRLKALPSSLVFVFVNYS